MTTTAPAQLAAGDAWILRDHPGDGSALADAARAWANRFAAPRSLVERTLWMLRSSEPGGVGTTAASLGAELGGDAVAATPGMPPPAEDGGRPDTETAARPPAEMSMEQLVRDHADAVYRVALSVTRDPMLAEDASQDALIKAWQALPTFRGDSPLRNWVLRIAHNTSISLLRKRRDELRDPAELPERAARTSVESQVQDRMAIDRFSLALRDLDGLSRSIIVLREVEGLSYDEMCDVLELPMPTIKTRLLRARRQLAVALEGWQP